MVHMTARNHLYFAFLSYSHTDSAMAKWLHNQLENFQVPSAIAGKLTEHGIVPSRLTPIFRDRGELAAAGDLGTEIREALAASRFLIVLCSPAAAKSRWTNAEIDAFKRSRPDGCVLAAIISGEPFASDIPGRHNEECLPPALRIHYDRRGRPTQRAAEPLAADLREAGDGRRIGFLKLVAGLTGVGLDDLIQRDSIRRHRRMALLAAASIAGMAVTSALAVTAIEARDAARDQRREAEGLVGFMLGDLRTKLEPIGRLDALDGVGSKILDYYKKQDATELSDPALLQRSQALNLMAGVAYQRGNLGQAEGLYRQALAGTGEAVEREPEDPQRLFDHAQNTFWIGEIARKRGEMRQAEAAYRDYKQLAGRMVAIAPDNLKWRMEALYADENLGIVLRNQRRFDEASRQFQLALRAMEGVASLDGANVTYRKELANLLGWSADAERDRGRFDSAIALRERQVGLLTSYIAGGARDVDFHRRLIVSHQALGILFRERNQLDRSVEHLQSAVDEADRLIPIEPNNILWTGSAANARLELARSLLALGRSEAAGQQAAVGCSTVITLRTRDPSAARTRSLETLCLMMRARVVAAGGDVDGAQDFALRALASARREQSEDRIADRYSVAAAYRVLGDARQRGGNMAGAQKAWSDGLGQLPGNVRERPLEKNERAELLRRLGRVNDARPLLGELAAIGYRSNS
jgi:tetratricopeptide (TPR) repeat protein